MKPDQANLIASHLLAVLESEIPATTAVFSALPPGRLDYRPDQTSTSALALGVCRVRRGAGSVVGKPISS